MLIVEKFDTDQNKSCYTQACNQLERFIIWLNDHIGQTINGPFTANAYGDNTSEIIPGFDTVAFAYQTASSDLDPKVFLRWWLGAGWQIFLTEQWNATGTLTFMKLTVEIEDSILAVLFRLTFA
jgi:hypothetical protein